MFCISGNEDNTSQKTPKPVSPVGYILVAFGILMIVAGIVLFKKHGLCKYVPNCPGKGRLY